jgi:hypothetical protein
MMTGAFAGRNIGEVFPVVLAVANLCVRTVRLMRNMLMKPYWTQTLRKKSLSFLCTNLRDQRNGIDDRARCKRDVHDNPGLQMARFGTSKLPFYFDGMKCFYEVHRITDAEERTLPHTNLWRDSILGAVLFPMQIRWNGKSIWGSLLITLLLRLCPQRRN